MWVWSGEVCPAPPARCSHLILGASSKLERPFAASRLEVLSAVSTSSCCLSGSEIGKGVVALELELRSLSLSGVLCLAPALPRCWLFRCCFLLSVLGARGADNDSLDLQADSGVSTVSVCPGRLIINSTMGYIRTGHVALGA